jgi:uncharacterized membrane protein YccC
MDEKTARPSLAKRALALLVLIVAGWLLLKFIIGLVTGLATIIMVAVLVIAVVWALKTL